MILLEMTMQELKQTTERAFPDSGRDEAQNLRVDSMQYIPTSGGVIAKGKVVNTNKGSEYHTTVFIEDVEYTNENDPEKIEMNGADGTKHYIKPIDATAVDVKVNCTCMDFHYRFALWNYNKDSLYGEKPEPYQRKTTTRPAANPTQSAGVCKHLYKTFSEIEQLLTP